MKRETIIEMRRGAGLTQSQVAEKIGISRSFYAMIELGKRGCSMNNWIKIGDALHIPKNELLEIAIAAEENGE